MRRSATLVTVLLTMGLAACGGGDGGSDAAPAAASPPPSAPPPAPADSAQRLAAIAAVDSLLRTPSEYLQLASVTAGWDYMYSFYASSQCPLSGFRQILLDGAPWYIRLPTGRHTLSAQFDSCKFSGPMADLLLKGSAEAVYEMPAPENVSATVTMTQFTEDTYGPGLLADGPASYTIERSSNVYKSLIDLRPGATLTDSASTNRIAFVGGRYTYVSDRSANPGTDTQELVGVILDFNGVRYLLDGRIVASSSGSTWTCTGEVRITDSNGGLAARKYCAADRTEYEIIKPIPLFYGPR